MQALVQSDTGLIEGTGINLVTNDPDKHVVELTPEQIAALPMPGSGAAYLGDDGTITIVEVPLPPPPVTYFDDVPVASQIRTTDATPTSAYVLTLDALTGYLGIVTLVGVDAGTGALLALEASFSVKRLNAGAVAVGTPVVIARHQDAGANAWRLDASVQGNDAVLTVTGVAGHTIDWNIVGTMRRFAPEGLV
jgi:hypothetical protein